MTVLKKCVSGILEFELEDGDGGVLRFVESEEELQRIDKEAKKEVSAAKRNAWNAFLGEIKDEVSQLASILDKLSEKSSNGMFIRKIKK